MNCSEFERELEQLVETRGNSLPEAATIHTSQCACCQQMWNDHQTLAAAMASWRSVTVPSSLAAAVFDKLSDLRPMRTTVFPARRANRGSIAVAAVAMLLVGMGVGMTRWSGTIEDRLAQQQRHSTMEPLQVASSMAAVLDDLRTEYRGLAADTSATARDLVITLPSSPVVPWIDSPPIMEPASTNDEPAASPNAVTALGSSIGTQISQAMDFLWTAVPDEVPRG